MSTTTEKVRDARLYTSRLISEGMLYPEQSYFGLKKIQVRIFMNKLRHLRIRIFFKMLMLQLSKNIWVRNILHKYPRIRQRLKRFYFLIVTK
jgi:hypothetical protein